MSVLQAAFGSVHRALSRVVRPSAQPRVRPEPDATAPPDELEASLRFIEAQRLDRWADVAARSGADRGLSDYELRHVRESEILPGVEATAAALLDAREAARTAAQIRTFDLTASLAAAAAALLTASADSIATLAARIRCRISEVIAALTAIIPAQPVSPRAPALARLA